VVVPLVVPLITTLTPGNSPMASITLPVICLPVCACTAVQQKRMNKRFKITFGLIKIKLKN
jgi:hypothetical protein